MNRVSRTAMRAWVQMGPRFLPFADAATPDLPLSRLLRLSLFQVWICAACGCDVSMHCTRFSVSVCV